MFIKCYQNMFILTLKHKHLFLQCVYSHTIIYCISNNYSLYGSRYRQSQSYGACLTVGSPTHKALPLLAIPKTQLHRTSLNQIIYSQQIVLNYGFYAVQYSLLLSLRQSYCLSDQQIMLVELALSILERKLEFS